ncbi:ABC transporter ATP-binding protein [Sporosarcina sp. PTS2304]|uniref:ABC-F family ATP-binding cassette domain-containing protein n=1 Tax=Sporosarcina sp. PTS2304 TaxID=2283194 RepID=UPI000E0DE1D3|nr:ABC-F family ATP-binding cassette domain-containing protein [Sporosarcina sp. PTS2304]AXH98315.1 ABC transporter ATP-binding protein [Sporosarcina sp. PTS2304]
MSQVVIEKLTKTVGDKTLFKDVQFTITSGEKVGLIGINGTGKSTLLSILAGKEDADAISMEHPNKFRIAFLPQEPVVNPDSTVMETVFESDAPIIQLNLQYEHALQQLTDDSSNVSYQERFAHIQNEMDATGGWDLNAQARTILMKLGIDMFDRKMGELSGGQKKRVALAKVLIEPADLLLLDEPTNHLDVESIRWLQDFIQNIQGAVLFITHDRYFLDQVATHIYELADQTLYSHTGNYADYLESKALRIEMAASSEQKDRNRYRNELKWIRRGAKARSTKQKARIGRFEDLEEKVKQSNDSLDLEMDLQTSRLGKKVLEINNITKSFGEQVIVHPFSAILQAKDRIAIIGSNGVGKTTLLSMLEGSLEPDSGEVDRGTTVKIAHFHQHTPPMDENQRIIEYIRETSNDIEAGNGERLSATQMLERFLFPSSAHGTPIGKLSGGERKRLYLLKLLMEQPNVLLLDEPTNDLDLETLSVLESFIDTFAGVVVTISHDRFFLDRTSRKLWILDGSGDVQVRLGLYSDFLEEVPKKEQKPESIQQTQVKEQPKQKKKMTYAEKKQWETIESDIETMETTIAEMETEMANTGSDYDRLRKLDEQLASLNDQYEELIERWSYLQELAD